MNLSTKKYAGCLCAWWQGLRLKLRIRNGKRYKGWTLNKGESAVAGLPLLVSLSNHLYCTQQACTVSIPGLKSFIRAAQEQVVWADPYCFAVCANFALVKQHETQLFLLDKALSSQVWSVNDSTRQWCRRCWLFHRLLGFYITSLSPAQSPLGVQEQHDGIFSTWNAHRAVMSHKNTYFAYFTWIYFLCMPVYFEIRCWYEKQVHIEGNYERLLNFNPI